MRFWKKLLILLMLMCSHGMAEAKTKKHHHTTPKSSAPAKVAKKTTKTPEAIYGVEQLRAALNTIVSSMDGKAEVGIAIKSMKYGDTLYTKNAQQSFTPASIMKVMTAEAALIYLGPQYTFPTTLLTDASGMENGYVNGNVYLVHSGDPTLTYNDLTDLMSTLQSQRIEGVNGNVYIDNTAYDQTNYGPSWEEDDKKSCFAAPINASIINHNCLSLQIEPGVPGKIATILPSSNYFYGTINNAVMTKQAKTRSCYVQLGFNDANAISLSGCMPKGKYTWGLSTTINDVMEYNKALMQYLFKRFAIDVKGKVMAGEAPSNISAIATHQSEPLTALIKTMLKMSDNIIAGSLFKKMGEYYTRQPGSWERGGIAVKQILSSKAGVDVSDLSVMDGSGLSRDNRVKPAQMLQVLDYAFHDAGTSYEFISGLPIAGVDGTLKKRLYNVAYRVRAKTGTMQGVVSLAGYVTNKDKEPIAFVIIVNGRNGNIWQYREMEDKIVTALADFNR